MQRLEVNGAVRPIYGSLSVKWLSRYGDIRSNFFHIFRQQGYLLYLYDTLHSLCFMSHKTLFHDDK